MLVNSWLQHGPFNLLMYLESSSIWKAPCSIDFTFPLILHWLSSLLKCKLSRQPHWPSVTTRYCLFLGDSSSLSTTRNKLSLLSLVLRQNIMHLLTPQVHNQALWLRWLLQDLGVDLLMECQRKEVLPGRRFFSFFFWAKYDKEGGFWNLKALDFKQEKKKKKGRGMVFVKRKGKNQGTGKTTKNSHIPPMRQRHMSKVRWRDHFTFIMMGSESHEMERAPNCHDHSYSYARPN